MSSKNSFGKARIWALLGLLASKAKIFLTALLKIKGVGTGISMVISTLAYWWGWHLGFWGAIGFVALIWIHEMGHVLAARCVGLPVTAPVFVPLLGALIAMKERPANARDEAFVAIGGPALGGIAAVACLVVYQLTDAKLWLWLASIGMLINLFNLIPVMPLDGGRIAVLFGPGFWWIGLTMLVGIALATNSPLFLLFAFLGLLEIHQRFGSLPRSVFVMPGVLAIVQGLVHGSWIQAVICGAGLLCIGALALIGTAAKNIQQPQMDTAPEAQAHAEAKAQAKSAYFNISRADKVMILAVYASLALGLGGAYWLLHGLAAAIPS